MSHTILLEHVDSADVEWRRSLISYAADHPCTLDGIPATIGGAQCAFAVVAQLGGPLRLEWAWPTVARVLAHGGAFRS